MGEQAPTTQPTEQAAAPKKDPNECGGCGRDLRRFSVPHDVAACLANHERAVSYAPASEHLAASLRPRGPPRTLPTDRRYKRTRVERARVGMM